MQSKDHKYLFYLLFAFVTCGLSFLTGCKDNPDAQAAKEVRKETSAALESLDGQKEYSAAQQKVMAALVKNRSQGLTRDAAVLASGNLALNRAIQEQAGLEYLIIPLRKSIDALEKLIRRSEELTIEKEQISSLLSSADKEQADLKKLLQEGLAGNPALSELQAAAQSELDKLAEHKASIQEDLTKTQATLDEYQSKADNLLRQAELESSDKKTELQQQSYEILKQRKDYYIQAQTAENQIAALDGQIALVQGRIDNANKSIEQIQAKIEGFEDSKARQVLTDQAAEIDSMQNQLRNDMSAAAGQIKDQLAKYKEQVETVLAIFEEAIAEFDKIQSGDAEFTAASHHAKAAHHAAIACADLLAIQAELNERLVDMLQTTEPSIASSVQDRLPIGTLDESLKKKTMELFSAAVEKYEKIFSMTSDDAQCSIMKSHVLALSHKVRLADRIGDYDLATQTEASLNELITKASQLGACFTASEAMRVINSEGLNYLPSLPMNMELFAEGLKAELSAWKTKSGPEQEQEVEANLKKIEELIAAHGQELAAHLEPLKQEMLQAKERGFAPEQQEGSGLPAEDPNAL